MLLTHQKAVITDVSKLIILTTLTQQSGILDYQSTNTPAPIPDISILLPISSTTHSHQEEKYFYIVKMEQPKAQLVYYLI